MRSAKQRAALNLLVQQQQDPSSPNYHAWLTPEQFAVRFGASPSDVDALTNWLRGQGFTIESIARSRGWIAFSGAVAQAQKAFHTEFHQYRINGQMHFANATAPSVPAAFEQLVSGIRGLDDFHPERNHRLQPLYTSASGAHALSPGDLAQIYNLYAPIEQSTSNKNVVIAGDSDIDLTDIATFRATFGLPPNVPQTTLIGTDPGIDPNGGLLEAESDIEWVGAVAQNANIIYVYSANVLDAVQSAVDQNIAPIISLSYGTCEANLSAGDAQAIEDIAQQANSQGITWLAASGDGGGAGCDHNSAAATHGLSVWFPASLPEVTAVGGTEFNEGGGRYWSSVNSPDGTSAFQYIPEIAWNDTSLVGSLQASGGGASVLYPKPSWQTGPGVPSGNARYVPDVSMAGSPNHDPYLAVSRGKLLAVGGTSLATPVFAGVVALLNQGREQTPSGLGNINEALYSAAKLTPSPFHDVTVGNNIVPCIQGTPDCSSGSLGYSAGPGYDLVTGLGSVDAAFLILNFPVVTVTTLSASPTSVVQGQPVLFTAQVEAANNVRSAYGPFIAYVQIYDGAAALYGPEGSTSTGALTVSVTSLAPGTHSITAVFAPPFGTGPLPSTSAPVLVTVNAVQPAAPVLGAPSNKMTGAATSSALSWSGAQYATSYDVYFGSTPSPPLWGNITATTCEPSGLAPNTTYYWKVVSRNPAGTATSDTWSFTTTGGAVYTINTVAGDGVNGFSGDGGLATQAQINYPFGAAIDAEGNTYIADTENHRVRKVTPTGVISTVAGTGNTGDSGDGGPAITAAMSGPYGIAIDPTGNVYVSSGRLTHVPSPTPLDQRVRMISPSGAITTVAGNGLMGYSGDGGPAANAELSNPVALATDSAGNLYIADAGNNCIRKVSGGIIATVAGQCGPPNYTSSLGDGGPATSAVLYNPWGLAVDSSGNLYISDSGHNRIRKVSNGIISTLAGSVEGYSGDGGPAINATFSFPTGIAVDTKGNIFISGGSNVIREIANGVINTIAGYIGGFLTGDGGPAVGADIGYPYGVAVDTSGHIFIADHDQSTIRILSLYTKAPVPQINPAGIVSDASFAAPVSPGSIASVFGSFELYTPSQAANVPLPGAVSGLSIQFQLPGGVVNAPLFFASAAQANIQIPWEATGLSQVPVAAVLNGVVGPSQTLALAPYSPAIFTTNAQGTGQGAIVDQNYRLADLTNPVSSGDIVQIFCTGLGPVNSPPPTGSPSSVSVPSPTMATPLVTIGHAQATVLFSGLAPGSVGEYQVNARVPANVSVGAAVPVVISVQGVNSNTATIAVH